MTKRFSFCYVCNMMVTKWGLYEVFSIWFSSLAVLSACVGCASHFTIFYVTWRAHFAWTALVECDDDFELVGSIRGDVLRRGNPGSGDKSALQRSAHHHVLHADASARKNLSLERGRLRCLRLLGLYDSPVFPDSFRIYSCAFNARGNNARVDVIARSFAVEFDDDSELVGSIWGDVLRRRDSRSGDKPVVQRNAYHHVAYADA
jgi:hypothetical protein